MSERYARRLELERDGIDREAGTFSMVMATGGEASDGHILSIPGMELPESIPLQVDHSRAIAANVGSVTNLSPGRADGVDVLRGTGAIRLTGDGAGLAARRDLVDAIDSGDVSGVSLSWEGLEVVERRSLPKDHPAHVPRNETDVRKRYGLFFEKSRPLEQSLVAIPADRAALVERAESATTDETRALWQTLRDGLDSPGETPESAIIRALEGQVAALEERARDAEARASSDHTPEPMPDWGAIMRSLETRWADIESRQAAALEDALASFYERVTGRPYDG